MWAKSINHEYDEDIVARLSWQGWLAPHLDRKSKENWTKGQLQSPGYHHHLSRKANIVASIPQYGTGCYTSAFHRLMCGGVAIQKVIRYQPHKLDAAWSTILIPSNQYALMPEMQDSSIKHEVATECWNMTNNEDWKGLHNARRQSLED